MDRIPTDRSSEINARGVEVLIVLCQDVSIWKLFNKDWSCTLEASNPATSTIPIPGTSYKKGKEKIFVSGVFAEGEGLDIFVSCANEVDVWEEKLENFLKLYEPLEVTDNAK